MSIRFKDDLSRFFPRRMKSTLLQVDDFCWPYKWQSKWSQITLGWVTRDVPPLIVWVSYGYGYTRGSDRVWVEIFGAGRVRVRVASSATGTGRVAETVDRHTPSS